MPEYVTRTILLTAMSRLGFRPSAFDQLTITFLRPNDGAIVVLSATPGGDFHVNDVAEDLDTSLAHQDRLDPIGDQFKALLIAMWSEGKDR
ncbi:MAG: hypothetical protein OXC99_08575 [Chloroflexi bacterium]|nr:hypothetical protein [Chloroflexota bacterium]